MYTKREKRVLSIVLVLMMILSMVPTLASADYTYDWKDQIVSGLDQSNKDTDRTSTPKAVTNYYNKEGDKATNDPVLGEDGVVVSVTKSITDKVDEINLPENEFLITLEVKTTVDVEKVKIPSDAAVVLLLDTSTSMYYCSVCGGDDTSNNAELKAHNKPGTIIACTSRTNRLDAMKSAAKDFVDSYAASANGAKRYIAVVSFDIGGKIEKTWTDVSANTADVKNAVKNAINAVSPAAGTGMDAGLALARNLLRKTALDALVKSVKDTIILNRYVVLFSDGAPNSDISSDNANFSDNITIGSNNAGSATGTLAGVNAAKKAADVIKNGASFQIGGKGTNYGIYSAKIYTIGYATSGNDLATGCLDDVSSGSGYSYAAGDAGTLKLVFDSISYSITSKAKAWTVTDPMGKLIIFNETSTPNQVDYDPTENALAWELKDSGGLYDETTNIYSHTYKYRIKLDTLHEDFVAETWYETNGDTTLQYIMVDENDKAIGDEVYEAAFDVPKVQGFDGEIKFVKVDETGEPLDGFQFVLTTEDDEDWNMTAISKDGGKVEFKNIPSGHVYTLGENLSDPQKQTYQIPGQDDYKEVAVNYGQTGTNVKKNDAKNRLEYVNKFKTKTAMFEFIKNVEGEGYDEDTEFLFHLYEAKFENGVYSYDNTARALGNTRVKASDLVTGTAAGSITYDITGMNVGETRYFAVVEAHGETDVAGGTWEYSDNVIYYELTLPDAQPSATPVSPDQTQDDTVKGQYASAKNNATEGKSFTNTFTKTYTVTVNYYYADKPTEPIIDKYEETERSSGYEYDTTEQKIQTITTSENKVYSLADSNGDDIYGTIIDHDIVINHYYILTPMPTINLTKLVKLADPRNMEFPERYRFTFTLKDDETPVAELTVDSTTETIGTSQEFSWIGDVTLKELLGKTLTLHETINGVTDDDWSSSFTNGAAYVKINEHGAAVYQGAFKNQTVKNTFEQKPVEATVTLHKTFSAFEEMLDTLVYQGEDGSDLVCPHEFCDGTLDGCEPADEWCDHGLIEHNHEDEGCVYDDENDTWDCGKVAHVFTEECAPSVKCHHNEHDEECYIYTFTFTLTRNNDEIDEFKLEVTLKELKELTASDSLFKEVTFNVPETKLPSRIKGSAIYTITETTDCIGWPSGQKTYVKINYLGQVKYGRDKNVATMNNEFGGTVAPMISISKTLLDERTGAEITEFDEVFVFELYDEAKNLIETYELKAGDLLENIPLTEYINRDATLTLKEIGVDTDEMTYDKSEYTIEIVEGEVTSIHKTDTTGTTDVDAIEFVNTYLETITPQITIIKETNGKHPDDATFEFEWSYEYNDNTISDRNEITVVTETKYGIEQIIFELPANFTGTVNVDELVPTETGNWDYDDAQRSVTFKLGVIDDDGIAENGDSEITFIFKNNYYAPDVELTKRANKGVIEPVTIGEIVTYSLSVNNSGTEVLNNLEVRDTFFDGMTTEDLTLSIETGWSFDESTGILTIDTLGLGESVTIKYTYETTEDDVGTLPNNATVKATGEDSEREVDAAANEDILVVPEAEDDWYAYRVIANYYHSHNDGAATLEGDKIVIEGVKYFDKPDMKEITQAYIDTNVTYAGRTYSFTDAAVDINNYNTTSPEFTVTLDKANEIYTITLNYLRTTTSTIPEPNPSPSPTPTPTPTDEETTTVTTEPETIIEDEGPALADYYVDPELVSTDELIILDEGTPLGDLPQTSSSYRALVVAGLLAMLGIVGFGQGIKKTKKEND